MLAAGSLMKVADKGVPQALSVKSQNVMLRITNFQLTRARAHTHTHVCTYVRAKSTDWTAYVSMQANNFVHQSVWDFFHTFAFFSSVCRARACMGMEGVGILTVISVKEHKACC